MTIITFVNTVLILLTIAILLLILRKIKRIDVKAWDIENIFESALLKQYRQLESLASLNQLLKLSYPLPNTRGWAGSPDFLLAIAQHAIAEQPENIVECSSGTSTIILARCAQLSRKGHVFSLENDPVFAEKTRNQLRLHGLETFATVVDAPLVPIQINQNLYPWYSIDQLLVKTIDLLVVDGPPTNKDSTARYPAGPALFNRLTKGATVFLDDANREGEREIIQRWMREYSSIQVEKIDCEKGLVKITT